jgi:iron complex outermembrane receptor protein
MASQSFAFYGDAIWHLTSRLNLTTGVRFSHDAKEFSWYNPLRSAPGLDTQLAILNASQAAFGGANFWQAAQGAGYLSAQQAAMLQGATVTNIEYNNPISTTSPFTKSNSWTDTSPRIVLDYKFTPDLMVFGSATKGYQSGGFNAQQVAAKYNPEEVRSFEFGVKSTFPELHMQINASAFYYKFTDLQSLTLVTSGGNAIPQYQITTSDQTAKGLDLDGQWKATRNLRLTAVGEYIDQKYGTYTDANGVNLDNQPSGLPLFTLAGGIDYTLREVFGGSMNFSLQHSYTAPKRCNSDAVAQGNCLTTPTFTIDGSTQRTDGRIGWDSGDHKLGLALYATNLLNNRYVTGIDNTSLTVLGTPGAQISAPRVVGVQLHWSL